MTHFQSSVKLRRNRGLPNKLRDTKNGQLLFSISNIQQKRKKQKPLKNPCKTRPNGYWCCFLPGHWIFRVCVWDFFMAFRNYCFAQILTVFCSIRCISDFRFRISDCFMDELNPKSEIQNPKLPGITDHFYARTRCPMVRPGFNLAHFRVGCWILMLFFLISTQGHPNPQHSSCQIRTYDIFSGGCWTQETYQPRATPWVWDATKFLALKGRYISLACSGWRKILAILCCALSGLLRRVARYPGRCPGLVCYALSGLLAEKAF